MLVAGFLVFFATPANVTAQDAEVNEENATNSQQESENKQEARYNYTAQAGDSYSVLARKAIQTYGINNNVNLSGAQIIYAETGLTQEASATLLEVGQSVEISEDSVRSWVDKAQDLSEADQQAWDYYVSFVDFDTSANG